MFRPRAAATFVFLFAALTVFFVLLGGITRDDAVIDVFAPYSAILPGNPFANLRAEFRCYYADYPSAYDYRYCIHHPDSALIRTVTVSGSAGSIYSTTFFFHHYRYGDLLALFGRPNRIVRLYRSAFLEWDGIQAHVVIRRGAYLAPQTQIRQVSFRGSY